jgi:chaperone BCS1
MDVWINFTHATKWQAEGLFKCFFPSRPPADAVEPTEEGGQEDASQRNLPLPKRKRVQIVPLLSEEEISDLAKQFAGHIPENELSVSLWTVLER